MKSLALLLLSVLLAWADLYQFGDFIVEFPGTPWVQTDGKLTV